MISTPIIQNKTDIFKMKPKSILTTEQLVKYLHTCGMTLNDRENGYIYKKWNLKELNTTNLPTNASQKRSSIIILCSFPLSNITSMVKKAIIDYKNQNEWIEIEEFKNKFNLTTDELNNAYVYAQPKYPNIGIDCSQSVDYKRRKSDGKEYCRINPLFINSMNMILHNTPLPPPSVSPFQSPIKKRRVE